MYIFNNLIDSWALFFIYKLWCNIYQAFTIQRTKKFYKLLLLHIFAYYFTIINENNSLYRINSHIFPIILFF